MCCAASRTAVGSWPSIIFVMMTDLERSSSAAPGREQLEVAMVRMGRLSVSWLGLLFTRIE